MARLAARQLDSRISVAKLIDKWQRRESLAMLARLTYRMTATALSEQF